MSNVCAGFMKSLSLSIIRKNTTKLRRRLLKFRGILPVMQSDIMLKQGDRTLVIDAKYYAHTTQKQYDVNTLHSGNLYQIFTYVKNLDTGNTGNVSGMLLYAKTDELVLPNNNYKMGGNAISVKTLDLDCDFAEIRKQLDDIVGSCFETI